jgi:hypothetical protein
MTTPRPSAARALPARTSGRASATAPAPATTTGTQGNSFRGSGGGVSRGAGTAPQRTNASAAASRHRLERRGERPRRLADGRGRAGEGEGHRFSVFPRQVDASDVRESQLTAGGGFFCCFPLTVSDLECFTARRRAPLVTNPSFDVCGLLRERV